MNSPHKSPGLYETIFRKDKIWIKVHGFFKIVPIGYIETKLSVLTVTDKDNLKTFDKKDPHLGLDKCILESKLLMYRIIKFKYKKKDFSTTRKFFLRKARHYDLFNGREMMFISLREFDLERAIKADNELKSSNSEQLNIFGNN